MDPKQVSMFRCLEHQKGNSQEAETTRRLIRHHTGDPPSIRALESPTLSAEDSDSFQKLHYTSLKKGWRYVSDDRIILPQVFGEILARQFLVSTYLGKTK